MAETIYLTPKKLTLKEKRAKLPKALQVLTSLKTTAVLGATLGALLNPALALSGAKTVGRMLIPKTAKGLLVAGITVPTAIGVLSSSKKAREIVSKSINPVEAVKRGQKIGDIIQDPGKAKDILGITEKMSAKEKIVSGLKTAGKVGGVIALGGVAVAGAKKVKSMLAERKAEKELTPSLKALGFTEPKQVGIGGVPVSVGAAAPGMPTQAPGSTQMPKPIQNIIQIQVH